MRSLFFNEQQTWRTGWRAVGFLLLTIALAAPLLMAQRLLPADVRYWVPGSWAAFAGALAATAVCLRLERRPLASVGFSLTGRFARQFGAGVAVGVTLVAISAVLVWLGGGFHFVRVPEAHVGPLVRSALVMLGVGLVEETVFHGYAFQRLIQGLGLWKAQLLVGVVFMLGHPVFDLPWGLAVPALLDTLFAALLLGLCFVRTQSLALPVGLHMGWNWSLGALGINVSGVDAKGWWAPVQHDGMAWLTGGTYGLEASPVDLVVLFAAILAVWRWRKPAPALALAS